MTITPPNPLQPSLQVHGQPATSLANLYTAYSPALLKALVRLVGERARAEDLMHDTFLKSWAHIHHYDPDQGGLYNWLLTIARRLTVDDVRRRKVRLAAAASIREQGSDHSYPAVNQDLSVEQLYGLLPAKYSQVLALIYTQGLTYGEAAQALALPLGTVKTRCRVGLQKLQRVFRQDIHQYQMV